MAILHSSEPVYFAANPKIHLFVGVAPGSKAKFIYTVTPQQVDPATRQYTETFYRYADANGVIEFDESPMRQRGAAAMYQSPPAEISGAVWLRNLATYFEGAIQCWITAAEGAGYDGDEFTSMFIWGGTNLISMINDYGRYLLSPFSEASKALTKATTIDVNKYLPSFLLFNIENATGREAVTLTATKGATSNALASAEVNGQLNTQHLATTYAEGDWALKRTDRAWWPSDEVQEYTLRINNDLRAIEQIKAGKAVYLRWLNSLGGYSFGLFEVKSQSVGIQTSVISRDYRSGLVGNHALAILQSDTQTLSKLAVTSLVIGRSMVGWDQFEDMEDLSTSLEVLRWYPGGGYTHWISRWLPVQISNGSVGDRSRVYNDFSCVLTMPQSFTQKR